MVWESGELDSKTAATIKRHVEACRSCQETVDQFSSMYSDVAELKAVAARWNLREAANEKKRQYHLKQRVPLQWITIGTAASLVLALAVSTLLNLTPAVRAEALLAKASAYEADRPRPRKLFKLTRRGVECRMIADEAGMRMLPISHSAATICDSAVSNFRHAGWQSNDFLSAKGFQRWRNALPKKSDSVTKLENTTAVTTEADAGPLRKATLELRTADYEPVAGRFEFAPANSGETQEFEVRRSEEPLDLAIPDAGSAPASVTAQPELKSTITATPSLNPADYAEAQVRLMLHRTGLDRDVLVAIERKGQTVKVWGLVAQPEAFTELTNELGKLPQVELAVISGEEEVPGAPLPWRAYQGSGTPLAYDQMSALFPNNPQGRQEFVNALDLSTRRVVAAAQSREGVLALAQKIGVFEQAALLRQTASDLQSSMTDDLRQIAERLELLAGEPVVASALRLTPPRAMALYTLVHEVVFLGRPAGNRTLEQALTEIRTLLQ